MTTKTSEDLVPSRNGNALLWHYTTAEGLLSIVERRELWASSVAYLNDAAELTFGRECLHAAGELVVGELGGIFDGEGDIGGGFFLAGSMRALGEQNPKFRESHVATPETYAVSFCTNGDLLSQWRGYGQGSGYAIGLDPDPLPTATSDGDPTQLERVVYGREATVQSLARGIRSRLGAGNDLAPSEVARLLATLGRYKDGAFAEESEHRLIAVSPKCPPFLRTRAGELLPYLKLPLSGDAIKAVRVGPSGGTLQAMAVEQLLSREGLDAHVSTSSAPYRHR